MELVQQISAILGVLLLLVAALGWLRHKGIAQIAWRPARGRRPRRLEVLDRLPLSPQHFLVLVRVGDRAALLGLSPSSCTLLEHLDAVPPSLTLSAELPASEVLR